MRHGWLVVLPFLLLSCGEDSKAPIPLPIHPVRPPCAAPVCAAPPPGCVYEAEPRDAGGCLTGCGTLKCTQTSCPAIGVVCPAPGEGCSYDPPPRDAKGCITGCGALKCSAPVCPVIDCAPPPAGCRYSGTAPKDARGCAIGCGSVSCGPGVVAPTQPRE